MNMPCYVSNAAKPKRKIDNQEISTFDNNTRLSTNKNGKKYVKELMNRKRKTFTHYRLCTPYYRSKHKCKLSLRFNADFTLHEYIIKQIDLP